MSVNDIEIIVGTYEEFLLGYTLEKVDSKYNLVQSFANHSHTASIRCVALNGTLLASGGADETVHLYDLTTRKESGLLMHHNGTVNCLGFSPDGCFLMSGGSDGVLAVHRTGSWMLEKEWGAAHKGSGVMVMSIHPSGKLALSAGADGTLRTWNLVKGRPAYTTKLTSAKLGGGLQISSVVWSPCGQFYAVAIASKVDVYKVSTASVHYSISSEKKVNCLAFINENILCIACDEGMLLLHDVVNEKFLGDKQTHQKRVKCVAGVTREDIIYVVTASSDGEIKLWQWKGSQLLELCAEMCGCRITCLTIATCGIPNHLKNQEIEDEKSNVMNFIPKTKNARRGVVVVELDGESDADAGEKGNNIESDEDRGEDKDVETVNSTKQKRKKKKKRKRGSGAGVQNQGNDSVSSAKRFKTNRTPQLTSITSKKTKKKIKNRNTWNVVGTNK